MFSSLSGRLPGISIVLRSCDRLFRLESSTAPVAWLASGAAVLFLHLLIPGFEYSAENLFSEEGQTQRQGVVQRQRHAKIQCLPSGAAVLFLHLLIPGFQYSADIYFRKGKTRTRTQTKQRQRQRLILRQCLVSWASVLFLHLLIPGLEY